MPAIACIPPWAMKEILELFGFKVIAQDDFNWVLSDTREHLGIGLGEGTEEQEPLILPKKGDLLALDVMMDTLIKAKLDYHTYFLLKEKVLGVGDIRAQGATDSENLIN